MRGYATTWGTSLIIAGLLLFLNTMGYLGWDVWWYLGRLWPLLLVLTGLALLWRRAVLPWGLLLLAVAGIFWYIWAGGEASLRPRENPNWEARFLYVDHPGCRYSNISKK